MIERLTRREAQLARMLGQGKAPRVIAAELGVSVKTVRQQLYNVQDKTGAQNMVHLATMVASGEVAIDEQDPP